MEWLLLVSNIVFLGAFIYFLTENKKKTEKLERFSKIIDVDAERERLVKENEMLDKTLKKKQKDFDDKQDKDKKKQAQELELKRTTVEKELERTKTAAEKELERLKNNIQLLTSQRKLLNEEVALLEESAELQSFGFYKARFDFGSSEEYKERLQKTRDRQKTVIKNKLAAVFAAEWVVEGSKTQGKKMMNDYQKLILRAFNGECDAAIAKIKYNNAVNLEARIQKAFETLNKLGSVNRCEITQTYLELKLEELHLTHEYQEKLQEEKEEQRLIREQMADEMRAQKEYEKAMKDAEKREEQYRKALDKARIEFEIAQAAGKKLTKMEQKIAELEAQLQEAEDSRQRAISQAQLTKAGHVYVISNIGSFGDNIYKIGMTRRLDPMDRVKELGDASVPFPFDVHAMIYSENAPDLENKIHKHFANRSLNLINMRKEFFYAKLSEIEAFVHDNHGKISFTKLAEASQYRQSLAYARDEGLSNLSSVLEQREKALVKT